MYGDRYDGTGYLDGSEYLYGAPTPVGATPRDTAGEYQVYRDDRGYLHIGSPNPWNCPNGTYAVECSGWVRANPEWAARETSPSQDAARQARPPAYGPGGQVLEPYSEERHSWIAEITRPDPEPGTGWRPTALTVAPRIVQLDPTAIAPPSPKPDRTVIYVAGGVVVLAGLGFVLYRWRKQRK